jgi:hypothetical protein
MVVGGREIGDAAPPHSPTNISEWELSSPFASSWPIHLILISIRWRINEDEYTYAYSFLYLTCNALKICFALHNLYLRSKVSQLIMILYPCFVIMFRVWTMFLCITVMLVKSTIDGLKDKIQIKMDVFGNISFHFMWFGCFLLCDQNLISRCLVWPM